MRNEEIRRILHVSPIDEVMRCRRLRWFGRDADNVTRRMMNLEIPGTRRRGRPKKAPTDQGRHDGRGCYRGRGPRPEGVETKDESDP